MKPYRLRTAAEHRARLRSAIQGDELMPRVLSRMRAPQMRALGEALNGLDPRTLVCLRYELASAFQDQLRTMAADPKRPDRSARRDAVQRLKNTAMVLRLEAEANLPWLAADHDAAMFFGARGPRWSPFEPDYEQLIASVARLEAIADSILSVPPIGPGQVESPYLPGFPSDRIENPTTWSRIAFARRIGRIYLTLTNKPPAVGKAQPGPYQRFVAAAASIFRDAYREIDEPYGPWGQPSQEHMKRACDLLKGPKSPT